MCLSLTGGRIIETESRFLRSLGGCQVSDELAPHARDLDNVSVITVDIIVHAKLRGLYQFPPSSVSARDTHLNNGFISGLSTETPKIQVAKLMTQRASVSRHATCG